MSLGIETSLSITFRNHKKELQQFLNFPLAALFMFSILLLATLLRLKYFVGLGFADDRVYAEIVNSIVEGNFYPLKYSLHLRNFYNYSTGLLAHFFGLNEFSLTLLPLLCSLGQIILIYKLGSMLINKNVLPHFLSM